MLTINYRNDNDSATFSISDQATGTEAIEAFCTAMRLETYSDYVIYKALLNQADELYEQLEATTKLLSKCNDDVS